MKSVALVALLAACFPAAAIYTPPDPAAIEAQQHDAFAKSMGYPTQHSAAELEVLVNDQLHGYHSTGSSGVGDLAVPAAVAIEGKRGTCYKMVMRLRGDAQWGRGADAGLRFDFTSPTGNGSGGPGVRGPGAVASVGCMEADGPISLMMAPFFGHDPIGRGRFEFEVFSKHLTPKEQAELAADKQRQIREQEEFAAQEAQKAHDRAVSGCSACEARYQGCVGAGRNDSTCRSEYSSCAFEKVGADYGSACPFP